jgi:uncharacterized membrane protein
MGAQTVLHEDLQGMWRAKVVEITSQETRLIPGTDTETLFQVLRAEILEGEKEGEIVTVENDYLELEAGEGFFLNYLITIEGTEIYSVRDADRRGALLWWVAIFAFVVIALGGKQGVRSLLSLSGSLFVILYLLLPALLAGYPPVLTSTVLAGAILFFGIYFTHGFNRESSVAFVGTMTAVILTSLLAIIAVSSSQLSGFGSDESVFLNMTTRGTLDIGGLLLGGIIIGILGVLDDIAVTQAAIVRELYDTAPNLSKREAYKKAIRVGKEHVGALVNTLALAYTGASLPLLMLFVNSSASADIIVNGELFATEIIRTIVGSIGLVLTVPITTLLAVYTLRNYKGPRYDHSHSHGHSHHG